MIDLQSIREALRAYAYATGVGVFMIDNDGARVASASPFSDADDFCAWCKPSKNSACGRVWLYGSYQAERFGGKYVFFCPSGLTHWATPLVSGEERIGALLGGPVLMVDPEEFMLEDLLAERGFSPNQIAILRNKAKEIPVVSPDRVKALSDLLALLAQQLPNQHRDPYADVRKDIQVQSEISEFIHQFKAKSDNGQQVYPLEKERELMRLITDGNKSAAQKVLNELLGFTFFSTGRDFETVRARTLELLVLLSRAALEGGADPDEIFGLNHHYLQDVFRFNSIEALTSWLSRIMVRFTDCVFNLADIRHKDIIFQAMNYIRANFTERISLEAVAEHVHLNASYLSRIFKDEVGSNFVTYVNKLRVDTAKKLLLDKDIPLPDVAGMVGFDEQSYFTKVFKKMAGVTPGKYRESMGRG